MENLKDFKLPKIVMPTDEQMTVSANRWWDAIKEVSFCHWNETLLGSGFELSMIPIRKDLIVLTLDGFDGKNIPEIKERWRTFLNSHIEQFSKSGFFFKLMSRSPKDSNMDESNHGKPMPLYNSDECVEFVLNSMRCLDDMVLMRYLENPYIVIRPYIYFDPMDEFRVLVEKGKIVGISQYYYHSIFESERELDELDLSIRAFVNEVVIPNMGIDTFVVDVVADEEGFVNTLETNPYGMSDPCLFGSYDKLDGSFLYKKAVVARIGGGIVQ